MNYPSVRVKYMGLWDRLFGSRDEPNDLEEHLVRVHIPLPGEMPTREEFDRYTRLEDVLDEAAQAAEVGELDGNEVGGHEFTIWLYGPNGTKLAEVVKATLAGVDLPAGCRLQIRHGGLETEGAKEEIIPLR